MICDSQSTLFWVKLFPQTAHVRLLTSVRSLVNVQVPIASKAFLADPTDVGFLIRLQFLMPNQVPLFYKAFSTDTADMRCHTSVPPFTINNVQFSSEAFVTEHEKVFRQHVIFHAEPGAL